MLLTQWGKNNIPHKFETKYAKEKKIIFHTNLRLTMVKRKNNIPHKFETNCGEEEK